MLRRLLGGIAKQPSRDTPRRKPYLESHMRKVPECHRTQCTLFHGLFLQRLKETRQP